MSDTTLSCVLPPTEDLSPTQARDLTAAVQTTIGVGTVRETAWVNCYLDRLQVAAQLPSQAQRDAARQAMPAAPAASASQASQHQQQDITQRAATL